MEATTEAARTDSAIARVVFDGRRDCDRKQYKRLVYLDGAERWLAPHHYALLEALLIPIIPVTSAELEDRIGPKFYQTMFYLRRHLGFGSVRECGSLRPYLDIAMRLNGRHCLICDAPLIGVQRVLCGRPACVHERYLQLCQSYDTGIPAPQPKSKSYDDEYRGCIRRIRVTGLIQYTPEHLLRLWNSWRDGQVVFV